MKSRYLYLRFILLFSLSISLNSFSQINPCLKAWHIGGNNSGGDVINAMTSDASGNLYVTGYFNGTANMELIPFNSYTLTTGSARAAFVCKYDAFFNLLWAKKLGGSWYTEGHGIMVDASGNVYTTGFGQGDFDPGAGVFTISSGGAYVSKLDNSGNFVWARSFGASGCGKSIVVDPAGNICSVGTFTGTTDLDPGVGNVSYSSLSGSSDIYVSKLDANGNYVFGTKFGSVGADLGYAIATDASQNMFIGGSFESSMNVGLGSMLSYGGKDAFVYKMSGVGTPVWIDRTGGIYDDEIRTLAVDNSGNIFSGGSFEYIADLDPSATTYTVYSNGGSDAYLSKYDNAGNMLWVEYFGGPYFDVATNLTLDAKKNILTTGEFSGFCDFDPGAGYFPLSGSNQEDVFISRFDSLGKFRWAKELKANGYDGGRSVLLGANDNVYVAGTFQSGSSGDYDPDPWWYSTFSLYSYGGNNDGFVVKFPSITLSDITVTAFPVCGEDSTGSAVISILDGAAPLTYSWSTTPPQVSYTLTNVPGGNYGFTAMDANGCTQNHTVNIPAPPSITLTTTQINENCVGNYNNGSATVQASGGSWWNYTYQWNASPTLTNSSISGLTYGTYTIVVTDANTCTATTTVNIQRDYNPAEFSYTTNGLVATFSVTGTGCNTLLWDFGNGVTNSLNSNPTITYSNAGIFSVCLQCNGTPPSCVRCMTISVPSNTTGAIGIQEHQQVIEHNISVFPNPFDVSTNVYVSNLDQSQQYAFKLFDVLGKEVFKTEIKEEKTTIHKNSLKAGIYFYSVDTKSKTIAKGKLVIE